MASGGVARLAELILVATLVSVPAHRAGAVEPATGEIATPRPPLIGWLAAGLGWGAVGGQGAAATRLELALGRGSRLLSVRYSFFQDTNGTSCDQFICLDGTVSLPRSTDKELAVQYGVVKRLYGALETASIGVAGVRTLQRGDHLLSTDGFFGTINQYNSIARWTVGATAEVGAYISSRFVSFGPTFVVDLNLVQPALAVLLDLHVGWMGPGPALAPTPPRGSALAPSSTPCEDAIKNYVDIKRGYERDEYLLNPEKWETSASTVAGAMIFGCRDDPWSDFKVSCYRDARTNGSLNVCTGLH